MATFDISGPTPYDSDFHVEEILERYDAYIVGLAQQKAPRNIASPELLADEIDELAQKIRIKLWEMSKKHSIESLKSYIYWIVRTEAADLIRHRKPLHPLVTDEDGEVYQGKVLLIPSDKMQDPALVLERKEMIAEIVDNVLKLPPRQQQAIICSLKDELDDIHPLAEAFRRHKVDIEIVKWPEEKEELQSLRASLSVARKKLRSLKENT